MISAKAALQLPAAQISENDLVEVRLIVEKLDEHINKYMLFGGPVPLEIPYRAMSKTAGQVLCYIMKRQKWNVTLNLIAEQPRFQGGQPTPHHWVIQLAPMVEVYDELLADFEIDPKPLLA